MRLTVSRTARRRWRHERTLQEGIAAFVIAASLMLVAPPALAASLFESGNRLAGNNARASIDLSSRVVDREDDGWLQHAVGLDVHKVFSGSKGDIGTLVIQPYLLTMDGAANRPAIFDEGDNWALQWRIANFNYTALGKGRFNLRLGHFELPFGLEQVVQTNGTLRQMNAPANTGLKADWGASINGVMPQFEYEIAYLLGSGNDLNADTDGVVVGRIGLPRDRMFWLGVSYLDGEFRHPTSVTGGLKRDRAGIDVGLQLPRGFNVLAEYASGREDAQPVRHWLGEVNWRSRAEWLEGYVQWRDQRRRESGRWLDDQSLVVGMRFEPNRHISLSLSAKRSFQTSFSTNSDTVIAQIRFRT